MEKPVEYSVGCWIEKVDDDTYDIHAYIQTEKRLNIDFKLSSKLLASMVNILDPSDAIEKLKNNLRSGSWAAIKKEWGADTKANISFLLDSSVDVIVNSMLLQFIDTEKTNAK